MPSKLEIPRPETFSSFTCERSSCVRMPSAPIPFNWLSLRRKFRKISSSNVCSSMVMSVKLLDPAQMSLLVVSLSLLRQRVAAAWAILPTRRSKNVFSSVCLLCFVGVNQPILWNNFPAVKNHITQLPSWQAVNINGKRRTWIDWEMMEWNRLFFSKFCL